MPRIIVPAVAPDGLPMSTLETIKSFVKSGRQIFGAPAGSLTWGIDGSEDGDVNAGVEGEKMTARILGEWLPTHPTAMLIHSVRWPGSAGDTDHMLLVGSHVIIIDSKRWKAKRKYSVTASGSIKRGTIDFPEGKVKMIPALQAWRKALSNKAKVSGIVCVSQNDVFVPYDRNWYKAPYRLVTAEELTKYLDDMIKKFPKEQVDHVNLGLLVSIVSRAIKPRDRRAEIINVEGVRRQP